MSMNKTPLARYRVHITHAMSPKHIVLPRYALRHVMYVVQYASSVCPGRSVCLSYDMFEDSYVLDFLLNSRMKIYVVKFHSIDYSIRPRPLRTTSDCYLRLLHYIHLNYKIDTPRDYCMLPVATP